MRFLLIICSTLVLNSCFPPLPVQTDVDKQNIDMLLEEFCTERDFNARKVYITKLFPLETAIQNKTFSFQIKKLGNGNFQVTGSRLFNKHTFVIDKTFRFALFNDVRLETLYLEGESPYYFNQKYQGVKFKEQYNRGYIMMLKLEDGRYGFAVNQFDYKLLTLDEAIILSPVNTRM